LIGFVSVGEPFVQNTISALFLTAAALAIASAWSTIRDRDRLLEAIRHQTDLNRRLSDTSRSGVFAVDRDLRVTMWNPALARCTGLSESSMLGTRLSEDCPLISEPASWNCLLWAVGGLEMMCRGISFQPSSGRPGGSFDAYYTPIFGSGDQPRGAVGIIHVNSEGFDVEERKDRHGRKASSGAFGYGDS
jgi:PAS domain-containing protein